MLKKEITYTDYDGLERTETFYFNVSKAEYTELELTTPGGLEQMLKTISGKKDIPAMIQFFKKLISMSYGVKSADGRKMVKNEEVLNDFLQSEAYSELFTELLTDATAAVTFIANIMPIDKAVADEATANAIKAITAEERPTVVQ